MKKKLSIKTFMFLILFALLFIGCNLISKPEETKEPVAEIHIPVGQTADRRIYTYDDVSDFTITLQGEDIDGNSVYEFCGDYDYDTTNDEIIIQIKKAGYYFVTVTANKNLSDGTNKIVANGTSSAFRIIDGDVKTIIIDMKYESSLEVETSTLYKFYNTQNDVNIYSIVFDSTIAPKTVENYVAFLKNNTSDNNWYDNWGKLDYEIDLDKVKLFSYKEYIKSPYYFHYEDDITHEIFNNVYLDDMEEGIYYNIRFYILVYFDENAIYYKINKLIDTDYSVYFNSFKTLDYIYTTDENNMIIEKVAYYIGNNNKEIDFEKYKEWKDFTEIGLGRDWVILKNPFQNIVSIDFSDTTTEGGIQINW